MLNLTPHEWLRETAELWPADMLFRALMEVAGRLDGYSIKDLFKNEMTEDE